MIIPANDSVSGHAILAARLETWTGKPIELDMLMLDWILAIADVDAMTRHCRGLASNMTGVLDLLKELMPDARWNVGQNAGASEGLFHAVIMPTDGGLFPGRAPDPANALLAAIVRGFAHRQARRALRV